MAETAGDFLLERLSRWGVKQVYGYPGDGINGIMGAHRRCLGRGARRVNRSRPGAVTRR
jgi:pyruvate dehydrogenase (quinone)